MICSNIGFYCCSVLICISGYIGDTHWICNYVFSPKPHFYNRIFGRIWIRKDPNTWLLLKYIIGLKP